MKKTGGAAFPSMYDQTFEQKFGYEDGMTLRDYFAAKAMNGMLANSESVHAGSEPTNSCLFSERSHEIARNYAIIAYQIADAMLAARDA